MSKNIPCNIMYNSVEYSFILYEECQGGNRYLAYNNIVLLYAKGGAKRVEICNCLSKNVLTVVCPPHRN